MKKVLFVAILGIVTICWLTGIASAGSTFNNILKKEELVAGITGTQPPLNATDKDGKIIGFDADLARAISASMDVKLMISKMSFAELMPALVGGKVDMIISGMTMTLERNKKGLLSAPTMSPARAF